MAGCFDSVTVTVPNLPKMDNFVEYVGERRNKVTAIAAGALFFSGWWFAIDAAAVYPQKTELKDVFHICGVFATISMFMINCVSNGQIRGDSYTTGCMGVGGARIWLFIGFMMGFGSLIAAFWILFGEYLVPNESNPFKPVHSYPGVAIFMQNLLIFGSSMLYKFGRSEDLWG